MPTKQQANVARNANNIFWSPSPSLLARMGTDGKDFVYLNITAYECKTQFALARSANMNEMRGSSLGSWNLLISSDVAETVNHSWAKYEAFSGKLMELMNDVAQGYKGVTSIKDGLGTTTPDNNKDLNSQMARASTFLGTVNEQVGASKLDASTVYQDSTNRTYTFEFEFVAFEDPYKEVYAPVRRLMELSCADATDNGVGIEFPSIFSIRTIPNNAISIPHCALVAVQPTWKFPWKNGYPMNASVALTFMEIPPLYKKTLRGESLVTTSSNNSSKEQAKAEDRKSNFMSRIPVSKVYQGGK